MFPVSCTSAEVVPIYKLGENNDVNNYRQGSHFIFEKKSLVET